MELELELRSAGYAGAEIARMGLEELQCRLLHEAYRRQLRSFDEEERRLLSLPFCDERELRLALRGLSLQRRALEQAFYGEHPASEEEIGNA